MAPGGLNYSGGRLEHATIGSSWLVDVTGAVLIPVSNSSSTNLAHFDASATTNPLAWTTRTFQFTSDSAGGDVTLLFTAYGDMTHVFLDNVSVVVVALLPGAAPNAALTAAAHDGTMRWFGGDWITTRSRFGST